MDYTTSYQSVQTAFNHSFMLGGLSALFSFIFLCILFGVFDYLRKGKRDFYYWTLAVISVALTTFTNIKIKSHLLKDANYKLSQTVHLAIQNNQESK